MVMNDDPFTTIFPSHIPSLSNRVATSISMEANLGIPCQNISVPARARGYVKCVFANPCRKPDRSNAIWCVCVCVRLEPQELKGKP